jgi:hypothetical protein
MGWVRHNKAAIAAGLGAGLPCVFRAKVILHGIDE